MTIEDFATAVKGCDCMEANVMSNYSVGCSSFTFDCDMMGPDGRVCQRMCSHLASRMMAVTRGSSRRAWVAGLFEE